MIVVFGLKPERLVGAEGRIDAVPEPPTAEQAGLLVDALRSGIAAGGSVIAIIPEWFAPEGLQRLEMARTIVDTARVAIHVTPLPPLAATALASLASSLAPRLPSAGLLASALRGLEEQLHYVTWLASVTGLKHPTPSLGQHVASLTPGSAFAVSSHPGARGPQGPAGPGVDPAAARDPPEPPDRRAPQRRRAAGSPDAVNPQLGNLPLVRVEATPGGPDYWGTGKLVEAVICPADADGLTRELMQTVESWGCRWCGELIARSPCPMCGHRARPRRRPAPQQGARK